MFQENPALFLADFGKSVTWTPSANSPSYGQGPFAGLGILDMPGQTIMNGYVIDTNYSLLHRTSDFPGLDSQELIFIAGVQYEIQSVQLVDDGVFSSAQLTRV